MIVRGWFSLTLLSLVALGCGRPEADLAPTGGHGENESIRIEHAAISAPPPGADATSAFLVATNLRPTVTSIDGVAADSIASVGIHETTGGQMQRLPSLALEPDRPVRFVPGGTHIMLEGLGRPLEVGDTVSLRISLSAGTPIVVRVPVLRYSDAVRAVR